MSRQFDWTEARVALLRLRRSEGLSAIQIAAELGCSRNAVLGMVHRLGLRVAERHDGHLRSPTRPSRVPTPRPKGRNVPLLDDVLACRPVEGTTLWDLRRCDCRWLLASGPPWAFCGRLATRKSYCEEHAARSYAVMKKGDGL